MDRLDVLMVTPIPPSETGLATFAERIISNTSDMYNWTVAYPNGGDPHSLPHCQRVLRMDELEETDDLPHTRLFQIGNSQHCFPVVQALYRLGGTPVLHETVLHHMLRDGYLREGKLDQYRDELRFCYGPAAEKVEKGLSVKEESIRDYDILLKNFPLLGKTLHYSNSAVCLNEYSRSRIRKCFLPDDTIVIGHPLSPLPQLNTRKKPFPVTIGVLGSNHPGRNLQWILKAIEITRKSIPHAGLVLVGGGYPDGLPDWVHCCGRCPEKEYQEWIRTLDYVMDMRHPTCGETSGSLLEGMRAGIPCIVSTSGSFINMPSDAVLRVSLDNPEQSIAEALVYLERNPAIRNELAEGARKYAGKTGSLSRLRSDWQEVVKLAIRTTPKFRYRDADSGVLSVSAAWHDSPEGFVRDLTTGPVTWRFCGGGILHGPSGAISARLTAWGDGDVNGRRLSADPEVIEISGTELRFSGSGWISCLKWKRDDCSSRSKDGVL